MIERQLFHCSESVFGCIANIQGSIMRTKKHMMLLDAVEAPCVVTHHPVGFVFTWRKLAISYQINGDQFHDDQMLYSRIHGKQQPFATKWIALVVGPDAVCA